MKKLPVLAIVTFAFVASACSSSRETASSGKALRIERKLATQAAVIKAIESRHYVIRMDKITVPGGGMVDLVPRNNFIIINGETASVSLAYAGRSFGIRQITGINFNGHTGKYIMKNNQSKGLYEIEIEVIKNNDKFNFHLTLGSNGYCTVSVNNPYIQTVSYHGTVAPLSKPQNVETEALNRL